MSRNEQIQQILDQHNVALGALRDAGEAFDAAIAAMRGTLDAIHRANHAPGEAITAVIAANQAALRLLREAS